MECLLGCTAVSWMLRRAGRERGTVASVRETDLKAAGPRMWGEGSRNVFAGQYGEMLTTFSICLLQEKTQV